MRSDLMTLGHDPGHQLGTARDPRSDDEEGGLGPTLSERVQDPRGVGSRPVVERQGDPSARPGPVADRAQESVFAVLASAG